MIYKLHLPRGFVRLTGILIVAAVYGVACTASGPSKHVQTTDSYRSSMVTEGWIDTYDYNDSLDSYLQDQVLAAAAIGKKPLLYIFDDRFDSCRRFRRRATTGQLQELFQDKYVIMLSHDFVHQQARIARKPEGSGLDNVGLIVPLDEFGRARRPVIDMFWSHSAQSANPNRQIRRLERSFSALYD